MFAALKCLNVLGTQERWDACQMLMSRQRDLLSQAELISETCRNCFSSAIRSLYVMTWSFSLRPSLYIYIYNYIYIIYIYIHSARSSIAGHILPSSTRSLRNSKMSCGDIGRSCRKQRSELLQEFMKTNRSLEVSGLSQLGHDEH